eukprot:TRINITY_DN23122_c0_g4_i1.p1 TRINITY_DN23122_c0_g4~~TRINITY_DN23122_c0_g4_i1.p1  ORF type:complete len:245 (-),score=19.72 TRINITY_DN23122_c0_g4_i1:70-735(-)
MSLSDIVEWLYSLYTSVSHEFMFLHGDYWILLSMLFQGFVAWGLFATAAYRVYVILTGLRDFAKEFASYGLPHPHLMVALVCIMEAGIASVFTAGIIITELVFLTSLALAVLMVLAVLARIKGNEPYHKMIPAATFGLVSLCCTLIDQTGDETRNALTWVISLDGRIWFTMFVFVGDLLTIAVTVYQYFKFQEEKAQHAQDRPLNARLLKRRRSLILERVV